MSFRSVLVCYTAGFTTIITTLRRITIGKEIYFLRTGILQPPLQEISILLHNRTFSYLFQQAKISTKNQEKKKNNSFYQSSIKLIYGRTEGKSSNDDSFEPPNMISANSIISISKSHGFVTPS